MNVKRDKHTREFILGADDGTPLGILGRDSAGWYGELYAAVTPIERKIEEGEFVMLVTVEPDLVMGTVMEVADNGDLMLDPGPDLPSICLYGWEVLKDVTNDRRFANRR
jgi:hypothetical protein